MRTLKALVCLGLVTALVVGQTPARAAGADLKPESVRILMDYAWAVLPDKFTTPTGKVIKIDKTKKDEVMIPVEVAQEVIKVAWLSARAQSCKLLEAQVANYRTMMQVEENKKQWTDQQMLYISQLHLFTVMWLTGNVKITEKDGEKEVVVEDGAAEKADEAPCTDEQKKEIEQLVVDYFNKNKPPQ
ncbi:MAG: hypothetical protein R3D33_17015 [Hyphomicrobiaceae bacterium]